MEPMTHLRENCLENQIENLDSQLTDVCALRTRLGALEEWGREMVYRHIGERFAANGRYSVCEICGGAGNQPKTIGHRSKDCLIDQAHTLGLVEEVDCP